MYGNNSVGWIVLVVMAVLRVTVMIRKNLSIVMPEFLDVTVVPSCDGAKVS